MKILQPPDWLAPRGYSNGMMTELTVGSRLLFVGGQIGWNSQQQFETDDFALQVRQTLENIVAILKEGGAGPQHIVRMTWYVKDSIAPYKYPRVIKFVATLPRTETGKLQRFVLRQLASGGR